MKYFVVGLEQSFTLFKKVVLFIKKFDQKSCLQCRIFFIQQTYPILELSPCNFPFPSAL